MKTKPPKVAKIKLERQGDKFKSTHTKQKKKQELTREQRKKEDFKRQGKGEKVER